MQQQQMLHPESAKLGKVKQLVDYFKLVRHCKQWQGRVDSFYQSATTSFNKQN